MRLSPVVTLGLTNLGILSWFWYGANGINASAYESSEQEAADKQGKSDSSDTETGTREGSIKSQVLAINNGFAATAEPVFSSYGSTQLDEFTDSNLPNVSSSHVVAAAPNAIAQRIPVDLNPDQIERIVSQTLGPVPPSQIERFKVKAAVAQSFGRSISTPTVTSQALSPMFSPPTASPLTEPALELSQDSSNQTTEAFYTDSLNTDSRPIALQIALSTSGEPAPISSTALQVAQSTVTETPTSPMVVPNIGRSLPVLAPSSVATPVSVPTPNISVPARSSVGPSGLSTGVDENYILGPGDIIDVSFFNVPEYSGQHRISTSGTIDLPLIGRTSIRGLTLNQAGLAIAAQYRSQLQSPIVSVNVIQQRPVQVAVSGEIVQPGLYTITAEGSDYPRLFQALQQAGGLTQAAALNKVEVRRTDITGQQKTIEIDLLALLQNGDINQNIFLQDGDSVVIPSSTTLDKTALSQLTESNLRANRDRPVNVAIVGEVTQPGPYQLGGENGQATVVQALQTAGGVTPFANLRNVQLRRQTRQGAEQVFDVNLWELLQSGDISQDLALQQGDTLLVPTATELSVAETTSLAASSLSPGTIPVNIIGEVESPGTLSVASNTSFNEALLASGGFNRRARTEATLLRFNSNGTVDRQFIEVNLADDINAETNPLLRPNDVIVVGRSARAAFDDSLSGLRNTLGSILPFLFLF